MFLYLSRAREVTRILHKEACLCAKKAWKKRIEEHGGTRPAEGGRDRGRLGGLGCGWLGGGPDCEAQGLPGGGHGRQRREETLAQACPNGIDVYFDNVARAVLEAVLRHINLGARIPLVGLISQYNAPTPPSGPNLMPLLVKRALIQGFLVGDHESEREQFLRDVSGWLKQGQLRYKEGIVQGLENAPSAFLGLFHGKNFGQLLVQLSPDPTRPDRT
jgi:hypothetical protein